MALTEQKRARLEKLSDENGIISALAFDQRGALKRLMAQHQTEEPTVAQMEELKVLVADELTKYFHLNLKKSEEKSETLKTAFDETTYFFTSYEFSIDKYPNVTVEFRLYHSPSTTFRLDYPTEFTRILIYRKM